MLSGRDTGFTIVELIITMVLISAVMAVSSELLMNSYSTSQRSASTDAALQHAIQTMERLGSDLRSARSPDRVPENIPNGEALRGWLIGGDSYPYDLDDISYADADQIWMRADTVPEPQGTSPVAECVAWVTEGGELLRKVYTDWKNCRPGLATTPIESIRMLEKPPNGYAPEDLFTYTSMENMQPAKEPIDPADCMTTTTSTPTTIDLNKIVRVNVDLRSFTNNGTAGGSTKLHGALDVRLRLTRAYQYGLGCVF